MFVGVRVNEKGTPILNCIRSPHPQFVTNPRAWVPHKHTWTYLKKPFRQITPEPSRYRRQHERQHLGLSRPISPSGHGIELIPQQQITKRQIEVIRNLKDGEDG